MVSGQMRTQLVGQEAIGACLFSYGAGWKLSALRQTSGADWGSDLAGNDQASRHRSRLGFGNRGISGSSYPDCVSRVMAYPLSHVEYQ